MTNTTVDSEHPSERDSGAILLLVLAVAIVLSLVVLALANFVAADLRYSQIIDSQAKTLASAESGIDYAVDRLRLNQTLCATDAAGGSPISLNGADAAGTPLLRPVIAAVPQPVNGTDTRITCERLDNNIADVAGWAVVITDDSPNPQPNDQIQVNNDTPTIGGPVFLPSALQTQIASGRLGVVDGDLWYTLGDCLTPYSNTKFTTQERIDIGPTSARGGICTTRGPSEAFSEPDVPALPTNVAGDTDGDGVVDVDVDADNRVDGVLDGSCHVFSPGRYTMIPDVPPGSSAYFQSGDYHLDFDSEWAVSYATVWAGRSADTTSVEIPNGTCAAARLADGGNPQGATFYFDRDSRLRVEQDGAVEMFSRQQGLNGEYAVSVQALPGSTTGNTSSLIRTRPNGVDRAHLVIHGLVWMPDGRFAFDNGADGSLQKLLGGIVAQRLWILHVDTSGTPSHVEIRPATSAVDTRILLTSKSTSLSNGGSTTVEAVVAYRPQAANPDDRVAITSFRVVD